MGKWLDRFKHADNVEAENANTQTDSVDILATTSTLSVPRAGISTNTEVSKKSEYLHPPTDSVDTVSTMSTLSVRESKEMAKNESQEFLGADRDTIGVKTSNSNNGRELTKQSITTPPDFAATKVVCKNCRHFTRDKIGDGSGIGDCGIKCDERGTHGGVPTYPCAPRICSVIKQ